MKPCSLWQIGKGSNDIRESVSGYGLRWQKGDEKGMELKELTEKTLGLFEVDSVENLGQALLSSVGNTEKLVAFKCLVDGELSKDWLQKIYQYYLADRKEKKQDYTPSSVGAFMGMLCGDSDEIVDMCAGSGALIIQKWNQNHAANFIALEIDENVIPFLLFNMVLRNINCRVLQVDALTGEKAVKAWEVKKGAEYGSIVDFKPSI